MTRLWLEFTDPDLLGRASAAHVGRIARRILDQAPVFRLALSGGSSPLGMFRHLTEPAIFPSELWSRTQVFFADERLVPPNHADSNFASASHHLLDRVPIPSRNIHRMPGELPPEDAALTYTRDLARSFGQNGVPVFDLIVLGMGADGHTASLFPGAELPGGRHLVVAPVSAPSMPPRLPRLTLTPAVLDAARRILFVILGADKHAALRAIRDMASDVPAAKVDARSQSWYICPPLGAGQQPTEQPD